MPLRTLPPRRGNTWAVEFKGAATRNREEIPNRTSGVSVQTLNRKTLSRKRLAFTKKQVEFHKAILVFKM